TNRTPQATMGLLHCSRAPAVVLLDDALTFGGHFHLREDPAVVKAIGGIEESPPPRAGQREREGVIDCVGGSARRFQLQRDQPDYVKVVSVAVRIKDAVVRQQFSRA